MIYFRSALFFIVMILLTIGYSLVLILLARFVDARRLASIGRSWANHVLLALRIICGIDYKVTGWEHLPAGPAVVLCKHQSAWETIALRGFLPLPQAWVLKKELLKIPFFGKALSLYRPMAIDRSASRKALKKMLELGEWHLREGRWIIVFPEGTRVASGDRTRFNIGGAKLAHQATVPVVPIAHNAGVFWARRSFIKRPGTVEVVIGPSIDPLNRTPAEINRLAQDWVESAVKELP